MATDHHENDRKALYESLGDLPPSDRAVSCEPVAQREKGGYILEALVLDLNGSQPVPAYVVKPKACDGLLPCVLCNHTHGGDYELGKDELICGRAARQSLPCPGTDGAGLCCFMYRYLVFQRKTWSHGIGSVYGDAVERPSSVGHDGLR